MTVLQDLNAANGRIGNAYVAGSGKVARTAFENLGSWRDSDVDRYLKQIGPALTGVKLKAAKSSVAFYKAMADLTGQDFTQPVITASDLTTKALRNGAGTSLVYNRPFVDLRTALSKGQSMSQAIEAGAKRAEYLASTEVQLARRNAGLKARSANDKIVGYIRTLTGMENCALCYVASTQRYTRGELMPIHPGCDCGEMPIYGTQDPGQVVNELRLDATHQSVATRFGISDAGAREIDYRAIKITEHGEMGPMLTVRGQASQSAGDVGELFGKGRVIGELSTPEKASVTNYARSSYETVNSGLRYGWEPNIRNIPDDPETLALFKQEVVYLDRVMEASYLSEDLTLYRGAISKDFTNISLDEAQNLIGQVIEDKGFVSTSLDRTYADIGFGGNKNQQVGFIIKAPKGTHGVDLNGLKVSKYKDEQEILLNRNMKFRVNKVYDDKYDATGGLDATPFFRTRRYVEMEVVNE
jgi:hypothetical protein